MTNVHTVTEADVLTIKVDVSDVVKDLNRLVTHWKDRADGLRHQWEESEWFLGEARATAERLQRELDASREAYGWLEARNHELTAQLHEQVRQRDEANWYLSELRTAHEALREENRRLIEQLAQARGERRAAVRTHRPDMTAEVRAPDGVLLFNGCPPNVSLTGLAFATDQCLDEAPDFVEITLRAPEIERPIEALGRLVWHEGIDGSQHWGCELLDLLPESRKSLEDVLANAA